MAASALPAGVHEGVRRFNAGDFFEAHELFEDCLEAVEADARWELLLGLIQVAVGYHKHAAGHPGASRMLGLGAAKLAELPPVAWGLDVAALRRRIALDLAALAEGRTLTDRPHMDLVAE
jgi:hypothetical protein